MGEKRKRTVPRVPVECPDCGLVRPVNIFQMRHTKFTGRCRTCNSVYINTVRSKATAAAKAYKRIAEEKASEAVAPCGRTIIPCNTVEIQETRDREDIGIWKGRCRLEAAFACSNYSECLDMAARSSWAGWKVKANGT